jgi:triosephosphate isomerase
MELCMRKKIVAGNWKMNKDYQEAKKFVSDIQNKIDNKECDVVLCVPYIYLYEIKNSLRSSSIKVGSQNIFFEDAGAYTGEISASMLKSIDVDYVIIGHSERRQIFNETDDMINKKVMKALDHDLKVILCIGETLEQRNSSITIELIRMQIKSALLGIEQEHIKNLCIAYEPIWAIGTGQNATSAQAQEICFEIRQLIGELYNNDIAQKIRILYGGSVNKKNAIELFSMKDIDGGLIGGASLKEEFALIVDCASE